METIARNKQLLIGGALLLVMVITRSNMVNHVQDASWAVFLIAGFYLRSFIHFPLFWVAAFAIDIIAVDATGSESYSFTAGYPFLIPAYLSLWFAGQWLAKHYREDLVGVARLALAATSGTLICYLISNVGFFAFSGLYEDMALLDYAVSVAGYFPSYLLNMLLYTGTTALIHAAFVAEARVYHRPSH